MLKRCSDLSSSPNWTCRSRDVACRTNHELFMPFDDGKDTDLQS